jgi:esterase
MAMNLVHDGAGYHWRLDFDSIHQLHASFRQADLWHVPVQNPAITFHFLRATAGSVITPAVADQLRNLALNVHLHEVPGGHWLNIDNPAAVVDVIAGHLPTSTSQSGA